ncbi:hypothetical protein FJZ31_26055 [Candidatus Poribacteria bacterium]|nr:hypothetical protein [Candidatus Poribacteria bacterium]
MVALTSWLKRLSEKFYALINGRSVTNSKTQKSNSKVPEKWLEIQKKYNYKYTYWNEELQQPVSLAIKPGSREEYLWEHPEEVRRILLEHGVDPDDDSMLGVIKSDKKKDKPEQKNT